MENLGTVFAQIAITATVLAVIVLALTSVVVSALKVSKGVKPLVSLVLGLILGVASMGLVAMPLPVALWVGGLAGLTASGAYDNAKAALNKNKGSDVE